MNVCALVVQERKSGHHQIYSLGTVDICTTFHANPSSGCLNISVKSCGPTDLQTDVSIPGAMTLPWLKTIFRLSGIWCEVFTGSDIDTLTYLILLVLYLRIAHLLDYHKKMQHIEPS